MFFNILTSKKFVVQIKQLQKKSVIIQSFRSKKLPKIIEIQQIREKTTSFTMSPCLNIFDFWENLKT